MTGLRFDPSYVDDLLDGRKTATVRYDLDEDLSPGDRIELRTNDPGLSSESFAMATVADVVQTELGDALQVVEDRGYQHNSETVWNLWTALDRYYPDANLGLSSEVSVVLLDEIEERRFVELERRDIDEATVEATASLSAEAKHTAASFVVRAGLGPLFLNAAGPDGDNSLDATPEEVGAFLSVSFDPEGDPIHNAVYEWVVEEATGGVVLDPDEAREIADLLEWNEKTIAAEFTSGPNVLDDSEGVEWAEELRRRSEEGGV